MKIITELNKLVKLCEKYDITYIEMDEHGCNCAYADYLRQKGLIVNRVK